MRRLKTELADGKVYTLTTLTVTETLAMRKIQKEAEDLDDKIADLEDKEENGENLTKEEIEEKENAEVRHVKSLAKIIINSLAKKHKEFIVSEHQTEEMLADKLLGMIDLRDMKRYSVFAMTGKLVNDEDEDLENLEEIDLTADEK